MAVFKKYSPSYQKDGYYVHVSVPGLDHPIPLQTPGVVARLYLNNGYEPGDRIPDDLVWQLYELDLHWTERQGVDREVVADVPDGDRDLPDVTTADLEQIRSFVTDYEGEYETELTTLVSNLEERVSESGPSDDELRELLRESPSIEPAASQYSFGHETEKRISEWVPGRVVTERAMDAYRDARGEVSALVRPETYRKLLAAVTDLESTLREHDRHPWDVESVFVERESDASPEDVDPERAREQEDVAPRVRYEDPPGCDGGLSSMLVVDYRRFDGATDLEIRVLTSTFEAVDVTVADGRIADFGVAPVPVDETRFDEAVLADLADEMPDTDEATILHSLVVSFARTVPQVFDFCGRLEPYEMASTDLGTDHYEMPFEVVESYLS